MEKSETKSSIIFECFQEVKILYIIIYCSNFGNYTRQQERLEKTNQNVYATNLNHISWEVLVKSNIFSIHIRDIPSYCR